MPNIFPWKLLRWSLVLRRFLRSIYFPTFLCLQALQCSGRVTFFQFILTYKKLWEMARRGWLVVVIGRLDPLGIFFSLSGRHLCNIIKLWRMGTVPQFSCKKISWDEAENIFWSSAEKILSKYLIYFLCLIQKKYHQWVHVWFHIFFPPKKELQKTALISIPTCPSFWGPAYNSSLATNTYTFYVGRPLTQPHIFWLIMQNDTCVEMIQKNSRIYDAI